MRRSSSRSFFPDSANGTSHTLLFCTSYQEKSSLLPKRYTCFSCLPLLSKPRQDFVAYHVFSTGDAVLLACGLHWLWPHVMSSKSKVGLDCQGGSPRWLPASTGTWLPCGLCSSLRRSWLPRRSALSFKCSKKRLEGWA